jgi:hypothetical protein
MTYSYDRTAASDEYLVPIDPTDSNREIAKRLVLHAGLGKKVRLSPRWSPKYADYAFWYDNDEMAFHAINNGRKEADLNGDHLALRVVKTWTKDLR